MKKIGSLSVGVDSENCVHSSQIENSLSQIVDNHEFGNILPLSVADSIDDYIIPDEDQDLKHDYGC